MEMKEVIEKVEKKLVAIDDVYAAMNYVAWSIVLSAFLILDFLIYLHGSGGYLGIILGVFWALGISFVAYVNAVTMKKMRQLGVKREKGKAVNGVFWIGWVVGIAIWFVLLILINKIWAPALGFLLFIIFGNTGIAIVFRDYRATAPVISSILGIPFLLGIGFNETWILAVLFAEIGYVISTMLYLITTFTIKG